MTVSGFCGGSLRGVLRGCRNPGREVRVTRLLICVICFFFRGRGGDRSRSREKGTGWLVGLLADVALDVYRSATTTLTLRGWQGPEKCGVV